MSPDLQRLGLAPVWQDAQLAAWRTERHQVLADRLLEALRPEAVALLPRSGDGTLARAAWDRLREVGAIGVSVAESAGGGGYGVLGTAIVSQAAHQTLDCGLASALRIQNEIAGHWLSTSNKPSIVERFARPVVSGNAVAAICRTEADHIWTSTAKPDGCDYLINATKSLIVNFANSDLTIVSVRLDQEIVAFVVDSKAQGIVMSPSPNRWGARLVDQADIVFRDVRVPADAMITSNSLHSTLSWNRVMCRARLTLAMDALALLTTLIIEGMTLLASRRVYVAGQPTQLGKIGHHQIALGRAIADALRIREWVIEQIDALERGRFAVQRAACLRWFAVDRTLAFARYCFELRGGRSYLTADIFHQLYAQIAGLAMSGGAQEVLLGLIGNGYNQVAAPRSANVA